MQAGRLEGGRQKAQGEETFSAQLFEADRLEQLIFFLFFDRSFCFVELPLRPVPSACFPRQLSGRFDDTVVVRRHSKPLLTHCARGLITISFFPGGQQKMRRNVVIF